jgi:hypothetical protein
MDVDHPAFGPLAYLAGQDLHVPGQHDEVSAGLVDHIAGNVNGRTIRQFPVVTEVCAFYQRTFTITGPDGPMPPKQWVRHEWVRSALSLQQANQACGVKNAATRKYLTRDWLWYWPPGEMTERLAAYANAHGRPTG